MPYLEAMWMDGLNAWSPNNTWQKKKSDWVMFTHISWNRPVLNNYHHYAKKAQRTKLRAARLYLHHAHKPLLLIPPWLKGMKKRTNIKEFFIFVWSRSYLSKHEGINVLFFCLSLCPNKFKTLQVEEERNILRHYSSMRTFLKNKNNTSWIKAIFI